jgi:membrane protein YdbS with pleckstrin-like domain
MTKDEFINAKHSFQRHISWIVTAWFVLWLVVFFSIGGGFRYWFHDHEVISDMFLFVAIVVFLVPVWFTSKFLHRKHRMVCPSCGNWLIARSTEVSGKCSRCQSEIFHDA